MYSLYAKDFPGSSLTCIWGHHMPQLKLRDMVVPPFLAHVPSALEDDALLPHTAAHTGSGTGNQGRARFNRGQLFTPSVPMDT